MVKKDVLLKRANIKNTLYVGKTIVKLLKNKASVFKSLFLLMPIIDT